MNRNTAGITMLELLVVIAIIGIIGGIGFISGNDIARRQSGQGAISTFQQSVWQGATMAASRGTTIELVREGQELRLIDESSGNTLRRYELPTGVNIPIENPILRFLPPGKIDQETISNVPKNLVISTTEGSYEIEISVIGEVRAVRLGND